MATDSVCEGNKVRYYLPLERDRPFYSLAASSPGSRSDRNWMGRSSIPLPLHNHLSPLPSSTSHSDVINTEAFKDDVTTVSTSPKP